MKALESSTLRMSLVGSSGKPKPASLCLDHIFIIFILRTDNSLVYSWSLGLYFACELAAACFALFDHPLLNMHGTSRWSQSSGGHMAEQQTDGPRHLQLPPARAPSIVLPEESRSGTKDKNSKGLDFMPEGVTWPCVCVCKHGVRTAPVWVRCDLTLEIKQGS